MADYYSGKTAVMPKQVQAQCGPGAIKNSAPYFDALTRPKPAAAARTAPVRTSAQQTPVRTAAQPAVPAVAFAAPMKTAADMNGGCGGSGGGGHAAGTAAGALATSCYGSNGERSIFGRRMLDPVPPYVLFHCPGGTGHGDCFLNKTMVAAPNFRPVVVDEKLDKATMLLNAEMARQAPSLKSMRLVNPAHTEFCFERVVSLQWSAADAEAALANPTQPHRCFKPIFPDENRAPFPCVRDIVGVGLPRGPCGLGSDLSVLQNPGAAVMEAHVLDNVVADALDCSIPTTHAIIVRAEITSFANDSPCPMRVHVSGVRNAVVLDDCLPCAAYLPAETRALVTMPLQVVHSVAAAEKYATFSTMNPDAEARHIHANRSDHIQRDRFELNTNMSIFVQHRINGHPDRVTAAAELRAEGVNITSDGTPITATAQGVEYLRQQMHQHLRGICMVSTCGPDRGVIEIAPIGELTGNATVHITVKFSVTYPFIMGSLIDLLGMVMEDTLALQPPTDAEGGESQAAAAADKSKRKPRGGKK